MSLSSLISQSGHKLALTTGASGGVAAVFQGFANTGAIEVGQTVYGVIAMLLALAGAYLSRLVTIADENRKLGPSQVAADPRPLTWIAVLIICPIVWHYQVPLPAASLLGLGVGYAVRVLLKITGDLVVDLALAGAAWLRRRFGLAVPVPPPPPAPPPAPVQVPIDAPGARPVAVIMPPMDKPDDQAQLIHRLDDVPGTEPKEPKP